MSESKVKTPSSRPVMKSETPAGADRPATQAEKQGQAPDQPTGVPYTKPAPSPEGAVQQFHKSSPVLQPADPTRKEYVAPGVSERIAIHQDSDPEEVEKAQRKQAEKRAKRAGVSIGDLVKVMATRTGYYGDQRKRANDVFVVRGEEFSPKWMVRVKDRTPERVTGPNQAIARQHDRILAGEPANPEGDVELVDPRDADGGQHGVEYDADEKQRSGPAVD